MLTPSAMLPLGTKAPDFKLVNPVSGKRVSLLESSQDKKGTLIIFMCNHCPYVLHILDKMVETCNYFVGQGVNVIAINANDYQQYESDSPDHMVKLSKGKGFKFPYLFDEAQSVAKAYNAACTPDFFLFDRQLKCIYRGRFDGSRPGGPEVVSGIDLKNAVDNLLDGAEIDTHQQPSIGCNIKWKD